MKLKKVHVREFKSIVDVMQQALEHEQRVTGMIERLYEVALSERDYATQTMLQWFITEQVEEEKNAREWVAKFRLVGYDPGSLLDLDRELGTRSTP